MRKLFSLNSDLSSHLFCLKTLSWSDQHLSPATFGFFAFLCFYFFSWSSSFLIPWSSLTSLAVLPAPPWLRSCCPFWAVLHAPVGSPISQAPFLLYASLLHGLSYNFHVACLLSLVHLFPFSLPLLSLWHSCMRSLLVVWAISLPSQTLFLNPCMIFVCPIPSGHVLSSGSSVSASSSSHASRLRAQSSATNFWGNLIQSLWAQIFAGCD